MKKVGIFYGSSTGNMEAAAKLLHQELGEADLFSVDDVAASKVTEYDNVVLCSSTWGLGDMQDSMVGFVEDLKKLNLTGKRFALMGMGDQSTYSDTYCDAIGQMFAELQDKGIEFIGRTDTDGYDYESSIAVVDDEFLGLALDADNQDDLTPGRIKAWVEDLKKNFI